jgi:TRAP-type uncharacterized transport system fused permease subunit
MKTWDDELQENIESGHSAGDNPDAQAYRAVFKALEKEPPFTLPPAFAHRVMRRIEAQEQKRSLWRELRALAAGILLMVVALGVTVYLTGFRPELGVLKGAKPYLSFIAFGIVFIALLHWIDRRFISRQGQNAA